MLENYPLHELRGFLGREVLDANGESVGFVDLVFVDHESERPEWLGIWNGVWETRPRVLVPIRGVEAVEGELRLPWTKDVVERAPSYSEEDDRGLLADHEHAIAISPEKERAAYSHYGLEPAGMGAGGDVIRLRGVGGATSSTTGGPVGGTGSVA